MKSHWIRRIPRTLLTLIPVLIGLTIASGKLPLDWPNKLDAMVYDARLKAFMPQTQDDRIIIIDIDEASLQAIGRWPWSRNHMAQLMDALFDEQQIAVLGVDIVFAEKDTSSGLDLLQHLAQGPLRDQPAFQVQLKKLEPTLDFDARFSLAMHKRRVVLGYYFTSDRDAHQSGLLPPPTLSATDLNNRHFYATDWNGFGSNIPPIANAAFDAGFFNPIVDLDGVVRSLPLLARYNDQYYQSLALAVFRSLIGPSEVQAVFPANPGLDSSYPSLEAISVIQGKDEIRLPVDKQAAALIPFRGKGGPNGGAFWYVSAADILQGKLPPGMLEGKIALLGTTAPGLQDMRATPVSETYPGVEAHANLLSGLLDGHLPVRPDYAMGFELTAIGLAGLLLVLALPVIGATASLILSLSTVAALIGLNFWLYATHGLVLPLATSVLVVITASSLNMAYGHFIESRSKRKLADLFGSYVPPELVHEMVQAPEHYSMQATERELTVMFSDMRGFTHLSESMPPAQLQQLLNHVFSRLTQAIRNHKGTIDKYMGDCVMAFWGAPVLLPQHPQLAVEAALDMRQAMLDINAEHKRQGLPLIGMGVGINTGMMCVGDMGSDLRRSYTVIGDAVNLGSRLEGVSKMYGVDIVVSETTRQQAGDQFVWQELDKVKVKGKDQAVVIFTVRGYVDKISPDLKRELELWDACLQSYRCQNWELAQQQLLALTTRHPDNKLYQLYLGRLEARVGHPAAPDWDGCTQLDTK